MPRKNSAGDTILKNLNVSESSRKTMAAVVTMDIKAQVASQLFIKNSPHRVPDFLIESAVLNEPVSIDPDSSTASALSVCCFFIM